LFPFNVVAPGSGNVWYHHAEEQEPSSLSRWPRWNRPTPESVTGPRWNRPWPLKDYEAIKVGETRGVEDTYATFGCEECGEATYVPFTYSS